MLTMVLPTATPFKSTWTEPIPRLPRLVPFRFMPMLLLRLLIVVLFNEVIAGAGGRTLNVTAVVVPAGVTTEMLWFPWTAFGAIWNVAVIWVELTTTRFETVMPAVPVLMAVAPVRVVPVMVTGTLWPATPDAGEMVAILGTMLNGTVLLVPFGFVTEIFCVVASIPMTNVAVILVPARFTVKPETVIPVPRVSTEVAPPKPLPFRVTGMVTPAVEDVGASGLMSSGARAKVVKPRPLLVLPTPGVVTEMVCRPRGALPAIRSDALTVVKLLLTSVPATRVTPGGRFNVAPTRPVPVRVTGMVAPVPPVLGLMPVSTGTGPVIVNVTALLVPFTSVTVMLCAPAGALARLVKVAVT